MQPAAGGVWKDSFFTFDYTSGKMFLYNITLAYCALRTASAGKAGAYAPEQPEGGRGHP
jgi:hypothetical protein